MPELIGGSADLTPSTKTDIKCSHDFQKDSNDGRYLRFGVREFAMFAIGNGISAYGCLIPFTSTFMNFITYGWGAVRVGALAHLRQIYIMTHDSIFLGEDGPTHQPVEVYPLIRATPNILFMRPCDGNEINAAWIDALNNKTGPSVLSLSRQTVKPIKGTSIDKARKGAYILQDGTDFILIATGAEVQLALDAAKKINEKSKKSVRVVSAPCLEIFEKQSQDYQKLKFFLFYFFCFCILGFFE